MDELVTDEMQYGGWEVYYVTPDGSTRYLAFRFWTRERAEEEAKDNGSLVVVRRDDTERKPN
jgi:PAS domain-containing protein